MQIIYSIFCFLSPIMYSDENIVSFSTSRFVGGEYKEAESWDI